MYVLIRKTKEGLPIKKVWTSHTFSAFKDPFKTFNRLF